jgi:hypothetical protein
MAMP